MFKHRCPWCGEEIGVFQNIIQENKYYIKKRMHLWKSPLNFLPQCPYCGKRLLSNITTLESWIISIGGLGTVCIPYALYGGQVFLWILVFWLLLAVLCQTKSPFERSEREKTTTCAKVKILWKPPSEKGLFKPRWQVLNGEIFPAYFFRDGKLVSSAWCVTIKNIHWNNSRECDAVISVVLDDAPEVLLKDSDEFKLFYQGREIAIGTDAKT